jgi:Fe-S oxidoreductase
MTTDKPRDRSPQDVSAGQALEAQLKYVENNGSIGTVQSLRPRVLSNFGIPGPKQRAENLILFGCYPPFSSGFALCDAMTLLDALGTDYTYLDKEYCCGAPMIMNNRGAERERARSAATGFVGKNCEMAEQKGAGTLAYFCVGCAHYSKSFLPDEADRHLYLLDLIVDKLKDRPLRMAAPKVVGYFPGCQETYRKMTPGVTLAWEKYRRLMDRVENLKIVDLPVVCCRKKTGTIVEEAEKENLDTIVCPCNSCYSRIRPAARGRLQVKHYAEILLQGLLGI